MSIVDYFPFIFFYAFEEKSSAVFEKHEAQQKDFADNSLFSAFESRAKA